MNFSYPRLLIMAGTTGTLLLGGCASDIVAEREIVGEAVETCPGVYRMRTVRRLEPVGEHYQLRRTIWQAEPFGRREYNPMLQSWERPWPYGPYSSSRNNW